MSTMEGEIVGYTNVILSQPPSGGSYIDCKNKVGHLLVFLGTHSITTEPDTMSKVPGATRDVATVDYVDLDDGQGGIIQWGARVDKVGIVSKLRGQRNAIMGRLILGEAKDGKKPPFILADHDPADAHRFNNVWMPANRAALAGAEAQRPVPVEDGGRSTSYAPPQPQAPQQPQYQAPQPQYQQQPMPVPVPDASSPWAAQAQPQPQYQQQPPPPVPAPVPAPQPVAAGVGNGQAEPYSAEAIAAIQRMAAQGLIPGYPPA